MGMSEDDRIRSKNRVHNEAFDIVSNLKEMGFSAKEMRANLESALNVSASDRIRNDIYLMALKIIGGIENEETINS